jgi:hypothetical protein
MIFLNKNYSIIGILAIIGMIVAISGCTSFGTESVQNKTFSKSGITFQYPGNWSDNATMNFAKSAGKDVELIGTLGNSNVTLAVEYVNVTKHPNDAGSADEVKDLSVSLAKASVNPTILSDTNRQINNKTAYELIYTIPDAVTNVTYKKYYVFINSANNKNQYLLLFSAPESEFASYYEQFKSIASSIKIQ